MQCVRFAAPNYESSTGIHPGQFSEAESTIQFYFVHPMIEQSTFVLFSPPGSARHTGRVVVLQRPAPQSRHLVLTQKVQQIMLSHKC